MIYFIKTMIRGFGWRLGAIAAVALVAYFRHKS